MAADGVFALVVGVDVLVLVDVTTDCPLYASVCEDDGSVQLIGTYNLQKQWP